MATGFWALPCAGVRQQVAVMRGAKRNTGDLRPEDANGWSDGGHRPRRCGGRPFAWEVAHLAFDRAGILARAPWGQLLGAEFLQEVVAKKGNASGQVR